MTETLSDLAEIVRIPSPAPQPQALACDGEHLWVGSWETGRLYGLHPHHGRVFEEAVAPGKPVSAATVGDELRLVCSEQDDSRFIRRYVPAHGFKSKEFIPCPDDTGSFLSFDGCRLWLSQRYRKQVLELDPLGNAVRTVSIGEEITGLAWVGNRLFLALWLGKERGGSRIAYIEPNANDPHLTIVARSPFVAISLARDGERFWTNDFFKNELVAFTVA
ncbi:MAG: hypothetical protein JO043_07130 [Candidatus Eremiobacteraeota bacterium]|nr:hypothetical protein [Candidatus Eremiobacteraeota bacterium]